METSSSDHSYSDQPLIQMKKLRIEAFPYQCCFNNFSAWGWLSVAENQSPWSLLLPKMSQWDAAGKLCVPQVTVRSLLKQSDGDEDRNVK